MKRWQKLQNKATNMRKVTYTPQARFSVKNLAKFITLTQGRSSARTFKVKLNQSLSLIKESPEIWPIELEIDALAGTRRVVINRRTILFYTFSDNEIRVVALFDARSNWKN
jgi:plasmid stabilization system protein ParE